MATIQGIYIALFGRPADPIGLAFFNEATNNGADLTAIGDLAGTAEYQSRFEGMNSAQIVTAIYQSLFGRNPELAGLEFFVAQLESGAQNINTIAINILDGAQNEDADVVANKIAAAEAWTAAVAADPDALAAYSGASGIAAGAAFLSGITADEATIPTEAEVAAAIDALVAGDVTGDTFTLTTDVDTFVGGAGNDTFRAFIDGTDDTLNPLDTIDGAGGTNTLYIDVDAAGSIPHSANISNIQIIELDQFDAIFNAALDSDDFGGVQEIWQIDQFGADIEVDDGILVGFRGDATAVTSTVTVKDGVEEVAVSVDGVLDGSAIDFDETTPADLGAATVSGTIGDDGAGGPGTLTLTATATELETLTLNISSAAIVDISGLAQLVDLDASGSTGDLTLDASTLADLETVLGGSGDDEITVDTDGVVITAGAGADLIDITGLGGGDGVEIVIGAGDSGLSLSSADAIDGFVSGDSEINFGLVAGSADNYSFADTFSSLSDSLQFVNSDLEGSFSDTGNTYITTYDGTDSYLFVDADGNGAADMVVVLLGIDASAAFAAGDIIA